MTLDDTPAPTRRSRARTGAFAVTPAGTDASDGTLTLDHASTAAAPTPTSSIAAPSADAAEPATQPTLTATTPLGPVAAPAGGPAPAPSTDTDTGAPAATPTALTWVDERAVAAPPAPMNLSAAATSYIPVENDLLAHVPRRSPLRAGVLVPASIIASLVGAYAATTLLWPLHAVEPTVAAVQVQSVAAPATELPWPEEGSAAVAVGGMAGHAASASDAESIASITKVVTALVVLDELPLAVGEQGPDYRFGYGDMLTYWEYRARGESALDVPVDGTLTEYQMLEGMLIGSANNYADRLASGLFPSDAVYADAAMTWLETHGVSGVRIVEPTGIDSRNKATPEALIVLAQKALANPVIAEIVSQGTVDLPGAGKVENTNGLLADPGVVGIKTGTLDTWNLLSAKDVTIGETPVRLYASVLGQPDDAARLDASRALYDRLEEELQLDPSVAAGTLAGTVDTDWGDTARIVVAADASVVLWNGGSGAVTPTYDLGEAREDGDTVGSLTVEGPLDAATVDLRLDGDIDDPSPWWRLTHPLELFGLTD
ncbi:D-alanyl-D-alanine carboxypeptidase [Microbacterium flavescens]|uniref:D-alanyl-D-alanine carboxypeptidase n=1 Tax=Microbacterium flavescens TaxID=69366 RepID=UPI001BDDCEFA|nr:D-alanyl-D-alanine carboxypeptidase [Microbacterium flavescens]